MKRLFAFTGGLCILGSFCAASAPPVQRDAAAFEAVAMTTTSSHPMYTGTTTALPPQKVESAEAEISIIQRERSSDTYYLFEESAIARLEKRFYSGDKYDADRVLVRTETVDTWDVAVSNPHTVTVAGDPSESGAEYYVVIDSLPHGYSYSYDQLLSVEQQLRWDDYWKQFSDGQICLFKELYMDAQFPIEGTYTSNISVVNMNKFAAGQGKVILPNVMCGLIDLSTGEEIAEWNTTDTPVMTVSGLKYRFEDWKMNSTYHYKVIYKNLPSSLEIFPTGSSEVYYTDGDYKEQKEICDESVFIYAPNNIENAKITTGPNTTGWNDTTTTTTTAEVTTTRHTGTYVTYTTPDGDRVNKYYFIQYDFDWNREYRAGDTVDFRISTKFRDKKDECDCTFDITVWDGAEKKTKLMLDHKADGSGEVLYSYTVTEQDARNGRVMFQFKADSEKFGEEYVIAGIWATDQPASTAQTTYLTGTTAGTNLTTTTSSYPLTTTTTTGGYWGTTTTYTTTSTTTGYKTTAATTTTTYADDNLFSFPFVVRVLDTANEMKNLPGIDLRLVEYSEKYDPTKLPAENAAYKLRTLAEWNTSDGDYKQINCDFLNVNYYYVVESDSLPENYRVESGDGFISHARIGSQVKPFASGPSQIYMIYLYNQAPVERWTEFPKTVTGKYQISIIDREDFGTAIPDLDVEIVNVRKMRPDGTECDLYSDEGEFVLGDKILSYNTSDSEGLFTQKVTFNSLDSVVYFGVKISNVPECYQRYYNLLLQNGNSLDGCIIVAFNGNTTRLNPDGAQNVITLVKDDTPAITTMPTTTSATTTTTTTTTTGTSTIYVDYAPKVTWDDSPMFVGETRRVHVEDPYLNTTVSSASMYSGTDAFEWEFDKDNSDLVITARKPCENLSICINAANCAFSTYVNLTIIEQNTTTTITTTATTVTTTAKAPIADETLCEWAAKDYSDKNQTAVTAEISGRADGKVSITLKDEAGNTVDTYVIDETSGTGENAAGEAVNLPQTGNNAPADWLAAIGALLLMIAGAWTLYTADKRSRIDK